MHYQRNCPTWRNSRMICWQTRWPYIQVLFSGYASRHDFPLFSTIFFFSFAGSADRWAGKASAGVGSAESEAWGLLFQVGTIIWTACSCTSTGYCWAVSSFSVLFWFNPLLLDNFNFSHWYVRFAVSQLWSWHMLWFSTPLCLLCVGLIVSSYRVSFLLLFFQSLSARQRSGVEVFPRRRVPPNRFHHSPGSLR